MRATEPHFLLFSEALGDSSCAPHWRFILQPVGSDACLAVTDVENGAATSRLELLAVVRGLEALDQPSRVTLLTGSRYVIRGIRRGLCQWRERRWRWERFGHLVPIRDSDLWQRIDRALQFHRLECCEWHNDEFALAEANCSSDPNVVTPTVEATIPAALLQGMAAAEGPALVIVPRADGRRLAPRRSAFGLRSRVIDGLWRGLFCQIAAFWRPAFTRAA